MSSKPLQVVIAGGGTGGHLYPGIAVAREFLARRPDGRVTFAGTAQGIEVRVVPKEGFELDLLRTAGIKGKSLTARLRGASMLPLGLFDAWRIVSARRPCLVLGVGGYSSGPVVLVASLRGVPTMLLEQNAVPGLTNRLLARFVRAAGVTFATTTAFFGSKAFVSGNPVRSEFFDAPRERRAQEVGVLVFGGSQGAHAINMAMVEAAPQLAEVDPVLRIVHQTGERDVEVVRAAYRAAGLQAEVEPFFYDMGRRVHEADVIVCRAGATTIAEVTAAGKASILIPLPTATDDHQRKNAEALAGEGAAEMLLQADASAVALAARISVLARDADRRAALARRARAMARPDAARAIVDRLLELARC
jgi:UDP-N-acetylglucosamine--N-acetylmuramyl-(pentapeptide) pyrophosphoryl-undecaprenol N-acetylglucosamine transferase